MSDICSMCGKVCKSDELTGGYGINKKGEKVCFECCGKIDKNTLLNKGILSGYFTKGCFGNWPGTFSIKTKWREGKHNIAGIQINFWFKCEGRYFHGTQYGELCECATAKEISEHSYLKNTRNIYNA